MNYCDSQKLKREGFLYWIIQGKDTGNRKGKTQTPRNYVLAGVKPKGKVWWQTRFLSPGAEQEGKDSNCFKREFIYNKKKKKLPDNEDEQHIGSTDKG